MGLVGEDVGENAHGVGRTEKWLSAGNGEPESDVGCLAVGSSVLFAERIIFGGWILARANRTSARSKWSPFRSASAANRMALGSFGTA
jgi:hypothetical protein